jgi:hypothetical protein
MESVRFLASFIALEFEPRTYLPALTSCVTRDHGDLYVPEAEAIPCKIEVYNKESSKEYPVMQHEAYACPKAPPAQSVVPATDPLPMYLLHGPPFPTLFDVDVNDEHDMEVYPPLEKVESPFPTLFCLDLDECSS